PPARTESDLDLPRRLAGVLAPALLVLVLLGIWEIYVDAEAASSFVLPAPHAIASALWNNAGFLAANLAPTAEEVVLGIALALALGFALAVALHFSAALRRAVHPLPDG